MDSPPPLAGEQIASALGITPVRRRDGSLALELTRGPHGVRLVLQVIEQEQRVRLFIDQGRHKRTTLVGSIELDHVEPLIDGQVVHLRAVNGPTLTITADGRFRLS